MTSDGSDQQPAGRGGRFILDVSADSGLDMTTPVLGVPLLARAVLSARKAGFTDGVARLPASSVTEELRNLAATLNIGLVTDWPANDRPVNDRPADKRLVADGRATLLLSMNLLPEKEWLGDLAALRVETGQILSPQKGVWILGPETEIGPDASLDASPDGSPDASPGADPDLGAAEAVELASGPILPLASPADLPAAEDRLMARLGKETDGFMSRHFARPISMWVSRRVAPLPISPNQMTVVSMLLGLIGAPFFLSSIWWMQAIGGLLFVAHSVIDGCDGELARLKFAESRLGGLLDFWSDNVVHIAVFGCMAVGWALAADHWWPLLVGVAAVIGAGGSAVAVYWFTLRKKKKAGPVYTSVSGGPASRASKMLDDLSRRDFIYLVFALALFGQAHWFLALTAIGAPAFLVAVLVVVSRAREPVS